MYDDATWLLLVCGELQYVKSMALSRTAREARAFGDTGLSKPKKRPA